MNTSIINPEMKVRIIEEKLNQAFNRGWFDVAPLQDIAKLQGIPLRAILDSDLQSLHCMDWPVIGDKRPLLDLACELLQLDAIVTE